MHCNCSNQKPFEEALRRRGSTLAACWVSETASTNDDAKILIREAQEDVSIAIVADRQTAGRGTRGRVWTTPTVSLLLTVAVPLSEMTEDFSGLSLVVGAACVRVLQRFNPLVRLKWPNDLWVEDGKAAGILCEIIRNRSRKMHAVVGIGVNICLGEERIPMADTPVAALFKQKPQAGCVREFRIETAALLSAEIETVCRQFGPEAMASLRECWSELDAFAGRNVLLTLPSGEFVKGRVGGIGTRGELLFTDLLGRKTVLTDARIRPLETE